MKRAERRKERARLVKKRYQEELHYGLCWSESERKEAEKWALWRARKRIQANTMCSCSMCASPRYWHGNSEQARTRQELRSAMSMREQLEE